MIIAFLADGWGTVRGGINSFNYSLVRAIGKKYGSTINVFCISFGVSQEEIDNAVNCNVNIINMNCEEDFESPEKIVEKLKHTYKNFEKKQIIWVGHDYYTGPLAIKCRDLTKGSLCGVIHHMAYEEYYSMVSNDPNKINEKIKIQKSLVSNADCIFANGPKLYDSACNMCGNSEDKKKIVEILPGLSGVEPVDFAKTSLSAIAFGRIEEDEKAIMKQVYLAVAAWAKFLGENKRVSANMSVVGYNSDINISQANIMLKKIASNYSNRALAIKGDYYINNQDDMNNYLKDYSICFMLSREEGFGLTGIEAISAGIPLIVSKQSGLYRLLEKLYMENMVLGVEIDGKFEVPYFTNNDLNNVIKKIAEYYENKDLWKSKALSLREKLLKEGITWDKCAEKVINTIENMIFLPQESNSKMIANRIAKIKRIMKFSESNNVRKWFNRTDVYKKLDFEFCEKTCDILFINGSSEDENPLTIYNWLKSKKIDDNQIHYFKIGKNETGDILQGLWQSYYSRKRLVNEPVIYLLVDGLHKNNERIFLNAFSNIVNLNSNVKIIVFSSDSCESISDLRRVNEVGCLSLGALKLANIKDFFKLYQYNISDREIKELKDTGYSITMLKKCIKYVVDDGLSIKNACDLCMSVDYEKYMQSTNIKNLSESELQLASVLSLFEMPFSKNVASLFQKKYCKSNKVIRNLLINGILINNGKYSYYMNELYLNYFRNLLPPELEKEVCIEISKYYYLTYKVGMYVKNNRENIIMCGINSCKFYQKAEKFDLVNHILHATPGILRSAKKSGYYLELIDILGKQYENGFEKDYWTIYDYAHCLMITGKYALANKIISKIDLRDISDYDCKMGILRLKCEVLNQHDETDHVLDFLIKEYDLYTNNDNFNAMNNQLKMLKVRLYIQNREFEMVQKVCDDIINECLVKQSDYRSERSREYNLAVAKTYIVQKKILNNESVDYEDIAQIKGLFKNLNDRRGFSWILGLEGECLLKDNPDMAYKCIKNSLNNRREMNEKSLEYSNWLNELRTSIENQEIVDLIDKEQNRIRAFN